MKPAGSEVKGRIPTPKAGFGWSPAKVTLSSDIRRPTEPTSFYVELGFFRILVKNTKKVKKSGKKRFPSNYGSLKAL